MPEWARVRLGEVLVPASASRQEGVQADKEYRLLGVRLNNEGPFLRETKKGADSAASSLFQVQAGDFIYSRLFAWRGALGLIPPKLDGCYVSNEFPLFTAREDRIDLEYLNFWFHLPDVIRSIEADCTGSTPLTRNRYKEMFFLALEIPLPPLPEQRRIVARVKGMLAKVEEARGLRAEAEQHAELLPNRALAELLQPDSIWTEATVGDVAASVDSGWSPQCEQRPAHADEWGVLRTTAVQWREFRPEENKVLPPGLAARPELAAVKGDVLVTRAGPRKRVGVVATVRENHSNLMISDKLIRIRPDQTKVTPDFLSLSLSSSFSQEYLVQRKTGLADAQVNISQKILGNTPLIYPALPLQLEIVELWEARQRQYGEITRVQAQTQRELDALPASILARAFAGAL